MYNWFVTVLIAVSDFVGRCSWLFGLRFDFGCGWMVWCGFTARFVCVWVGII